MAVRINVTAVRDCPPAEVRAVMSEVLRPVCKTEDCRPLGDQLELTEHGGWVWFTTSVWGVSANDLNRGLCRLARPALQFTTSDGDRWYLTVHGGPTGQVHFNHEFHVFRSDPDPAQDEEREAELNQVEEPPEIDPALAFLEDAPPPGPTRPRVPFDLIAGEANELGPPVPEEFRAAVAALPYSQAVARYRRWHADQVIAALAGAGIPLDAAAARNALLWEGITPQESDSDLGNLPRLLVALGLGGQWDDYLRQAESPLQPASEVPAADADEEDIPDGAGDDSEPDDTPPPNLLDPILRLTDAVPLSAVGGGTVAVPVKRLSQVAFLAEAFSIDDGPGVVLTVTLPPGTSMPETADDLPVAEDLQIVRTADGFRVGLADAGTLDWQFLRNFLGKKLARLLARPADGMVLDLAFAAEGHPALVQRYRGTVQSEQWHIAETYPPLTAETLTGALELARRRDKDRYPVRDEAEADALRELAARDPNLRDGKLDWKGLNVSYEYDFNGSLAMALFRLRHGAAWDLAAYEREAAQKVAEQIERERQMRKAAIEAARRRAAPHEAEIVHRGKHGPYWRSDFLQLTELEQETREKWDSAVEALGMRHLGDLVAKKQRDIVLRLHAAADGACYAVLMGKRTMYLGYEFFTRFHNGTTLTTTTNGAVDSRPEAGVYYKHGSGLTPEALYQKHLWGVEQFRSHKQTTPVTLPLTLEGVAQELDAAFDRAADATPRELISVETVPLEMPADSGQDADWEEE